MTLFAGAVPAMRMAGAALGKYLTSPQTLKNIGTKVAVDTALGTAVSQAVPLILGQEPSVTPLQAAIHSGAGSLVGSPIAGGMRAMGLPGIAADSAASILGGAGAQVVSQSINQGLHGRMQPVSQAVAPEPGDQMSPDTAQLMQLQRMHAEMEQQRYNNEINLALAKNYHAPMTTVVHKNPSAELQSIIGMLNPDVRY
jgi:hypothetical protein